jgi:hypothetical protein
MLFDNSTNKVEEAKFVKTNKVEKDLDEDF